MKTLKVVGLGFVMILVMSFSANACVSRTETVDDGAGNALVTALIIIAVKTVN